LTSLGGLLEDSNVIIVRGDDQGIRLVGTTERCTSSIGIGNGDLILTIEFEIAKCGVIFIELHG